MSDVYTRSDIDAAIRRLYAIDNDRWYAGDERSRFTGAVIDGGIRLGGNVQGFASFVERTTRKDEWGDLENFLIFKVTDDDGYARHFSIRGYESSYEGIEYDGAISEVKPVEKTITTYESLES